MNKKNLFAITLAIATVFGASAQKFNPSAKFLKGEKQINVVFDYSQVTFDGDSKDSYYKYKGQSWVEEWEGKRKENDENNYLDKLNKELSKIDMNAGAYPEVQYTIIVNVVDCDFGSYAGPFSAPAKLKCTLQVVKTGSTEILSSITLKRSQNSYTTIGTPVDFDRMYLAFGYGGEKVGEILVKELK